MSKLAVTPQRLVLREAIYALQAAINSTRIVASFHASTKALPEGSDAVIEAGIKAGTQAVFEWPNANTKGYENQILLLWTEAYAKVAGITVDKARTAVQVAHDEYEHLRGRLAQLWQTSCAMNHAEPHKTARNEALTAFTALCDSYGVTSSITFQDVTEDHRQACVVCQTRA